MQISAYSFPRSQLRFGTSQDDRKKAIEAKAMEIKTLILQYAPDLQQLGVQVKDITSSYSAQTVDILLESPDKASAEERVKNLTGFLVQEYLPSSTNFQYAASVIHNGIGTVPLENGMKIIISTPWSTVNPT